jgi:hypothetical protein
MKSIVKVLAVTAALMSLSGLFFAASADDEEIDKGRRVSSGASRSHVQPSRPQYHAPAPRVSAPSVSRVRTGASTPTRQSTYQPTPVRQQSARMPENGYRPGVFNPPQYGDTRVWTADRRRQPAQPGPGSTPSTMRPAGRLDDVASTRLVRPNPFPGQSVEPQVPDNRGASRTVSAPRSTAVPRPTASQFIGSGSQPQFRPSRAVSDAIDASTQPISYQRQPSAQTPVSASPDTMPDTSADPRAVVQSGPAGLGMDAVAYVSSLGGPVVSTPVGGLIGGASLATARNNQERAMAIGSTALGAVSPGANAALMVPYHGVQTCVEFGTVWGHALSGLGHMRDTQEAGEAYLNTK